MIYDFDLGENIKKKSLYESIAKEILGAWEIRSFRDLKKKYFELAKIYHPDINNNALALDKFRDILLSYKILAQWDDSILKETFVTISNWDIEIIKIKAKMKEKSYFAKWKELYY